MPASENLHISGHPATAGYPRPNLQAAIRASRLPNAMVGLTAPRQYSPTRAPDGPALRDADQLPLAPLAAAAATGAVVPALDPVAPLASVAAATGLPDDAPP